MSMVTVSASDRRSPVELHVVAPGVMHVLSGGGTCVVDLDAGSTMTVSAEAPEHPTVSKESLLDRLGHAVAGVWTGIGHAGEDVSAEAEDAYRSVLRAIGDAPPAEDPAPETKPDPAPEPTPEK